MRYSKVHIDALGYELAPVVVASAELEERLAPVWQHLHIPAGQLEELTGIQERRWWEPGYPLSQGASAAGRKALATAGIDAADLGALLYAGVCREGFEPATACAVAAALKVGPRAAVLDVSNACLGVLNGMVDIANRIELGQIRAGMVVSCESARDIVELTIERLLSDPNMERFKTSVATLTGGSGAVAVVLSDGSFTPGEPRHRLVGGAQRTAPEHHDLCRWGLRPAGPDGAMTEVMVTDSVSVLAHGVPLGRETWQDLLDELQWSADQVERVICHQVGAGHRDAILSALQIPGDKDFSSYSFLGNTGTVALPLTAALAAERGALKPGQRAAFLGIGSGLNCLMLGVEW